MTADVQATKVMIEYRPIERDGEFWVQVCVDRVPLYELGPFETSGECLRASDELQSMMRDHGAVDLGPVQ